MTRMFNIRKGLLKKNWGRGSRASGPQKQITLPTLFLSRWRWRQIQSELQLCPVLPDCFCQTCTAAQWSVCLSGKSLFQSSELKPERRWVSSRVNGQINVIANRRERAVSWGLHFHDNSWVGLCVLVQQAAVMSLLMSLKAKRIWPMTEHCSYTSTCWT